MKNPPTRPYTPEELEKLFTEVAQDPPSNLNVQPDTSLPGVILENNETLFAPGESHLTMLGSDSPITGKKINYVPYLIGGVILIGIGIYVYRDYQKNKENQQGKKS